MVFAGFIAAATDLQFDLIGCKPTLALIAEANLKTYSLCDPTDAFIFGKCVLTAAYQVLSTVMLQGETGINKNALMFCKLTEATAEQFVIAKNRKLTDALLKYMPTMSP